MSGVNVTVASDDDEPDADIANFSHNLYRTNRNQNARFDDDSSEFED